MKRIIAMGIILMLLIKSAFGEDWQVWELVDEEGTQLTSICYVPQVGDEYISADNQLYRVVTVEDQRAYTEKIGKQEMPNIEWLDDAQQVSATNRTIGIYCTHSDESYEPTDGYYSTRERGSIYQVAHRLAEALEEDGITANVNDALHHPHDAGAYRRSRQTAIELLREAVPDCLLDIHRDGIKDPASYETEIAGQKISKIRLLVGRGNQNSELNKEFALKVKAVADRVYPGLIKDIYMGKGAFNQDLLPRSILLECGTYTLDKEVVLRSMPLMADVLNRALYGGLIGSIGGHTSDTKNSVDRGGITEGQLDSMPEASIKAYGSGAGFLLLILLIGTAGIAILAAGSLKNGRRKFLRNVSEMTGGLIGKKPREGEDNEHS